MLKLFITPPAFGMAETWRLCSKLTWVLFKIAFSRSRERLSTWPDSCVDESFAKFGADIFNVVGFKKILPLFFFFLFLFPLYSGSSFLARSISFFLFRLVFICEKIAGEGCKKGKNFNNSWENDIIGIYITATKPRPFLTMGGDTARDIFLADTLFVMPHTNWTL